MTLAEAQEQTCENCAYCHQPNAAELSCRRRSPTLSTTGLGERPKVERMFWCGEYVSAGGYLFRVAPPSCTE